MDVERPVVADGVFLHIREGPSLFARYALFKRAVTIFLPCPLTGDSERSEEIISPAAIFHVNHMEYR